MKEIATLFVLVGVYSLLNMIIRVVHAAIYFDEYNATLNIVIISVCTSMVYYFGALS